MQAILLGIIKTTLWPLIKSYITSLASQAVVKWLVSEAIEAGVKSTKTTWDDELLAKVKEEMDKKD